MTYPLDLVNLALGVFLPMLTALVTQRFASGTVKSLTLLFLTVVTSALNGLVLDEDKFFDLKHFLITTTLQFIISVGFHYGLLKPTGVTGTNGAIATSVPGGIGGPTNETPRETPENP